MYIVICNSSAQFTVREKHYCKYISFADYAVRVLPSKNKNIRLKRVNYFRVIFRLNFIASFFYELFTYLFNINNAPECKE